MKKNCFGKICSSGSVIGNAGRMRCIPEQRQRS